MGFFSWRTSDTNESLVSYYSARISKDGTGPCPDRPFNLVLPDENEYSVIWYDGYGNLIIKVDGMLNPKANELLRKAIADTTPPKFPLFQPQEVGEYWVNVHILLYHMNHTELDTAQAKQDRGINIDCDHADEPMNRLKFTSKEGFKYKPLADSQHCPNQGYFFDEEY